MENIKKYILSYVILKNDAVEKLNLIDCKEKQCRKKRKFILNNIANIQKQQFLLLTVAHTLKCEKSIWQLNRSKSFWEVDCQINGDEFFKQNFRMDRGNFRTLCSLMTSLRKEDTNCREAIPLEKRIAIAVYALGSSGEYRSIANLFGVGKSTVGKLLLEFCNAVWSVLKPQYMNYFPLTEETVEDCVSGFNTLGFPQCLGAIDGCHIEVHPHAEDAVDYFNYKGWYSVILFAFVDYRYRFIYINVGSPGRCNDSSIYENSQLKNYLSSCHLLDEMAKTINDVKVPIVVLGDSAFRFSKRLMKPYPFHCEQDGYQKNFNYALSKSRRVVENAFGHLKGRFRRIGKGIDNAIENANAIIKACCVLHNFLNQRNDKINQKWIVEHANIAKDQPDGGMVVIGDRDETAENIRRTIARSVCTVYNE